MISLIQFHCPVCDQEKEVTNTPARRTCSYKCWLIWLKTHGNPSNKMGRWGHLVKIEDQEGVASAVYEWRKRLGLSQRDASERTGIYYSFFSRIENKRYENVCKDVRDKLYKETGVFIKGEIALKPPDRKTVERVNREHETNKPQIVIVRHNDGTIERVEMGV